MDAEFITDIRSGYNARIMDCFQCFHLCFTQQGGTCIPAKAKIVGRTNTVEVWSEEVAQPVAVRYAFRNYVGNITLRYTFGLSAFPFRTDTWDDVK